LKDEFSKYIDNWSLLQKYRISMKNRQHNGHKKKMRQIQKWICWNVYIIN